MDNALYQEYISQVSSTENLYQLIEKFKESKNMSDEEFYTNTELNRNIMCDIRKNKSRPTLRIVITICIGLHLKPYESLKLIETAGYHLNNSLYIDFVYLDLICHFYEFEISECNKRLEEAGIDEKYYLGSRERK